MKIKRFSFFCPHNVAFPGRIIFDWSLLTASTIDILSLKWYNSFYARSLDNLPFYIMRIFLGLESQLLSIMSLRWTCLLLIVSLIFSTIDGHPLISSKTYAKEMEHSRWRPFGSLQSKILPIAYATMNEEEAPVVHPAAILHGTYSPVIFMV